MLPNTFSSTTSSISVGMIGLASTLLTGCQTASVETDPVAVSAVATIAPSNWTRSDDVTLENTETSAIRSQESPHHWVEKLQDPELEKLIEEALLHNLDLKIAAARMESSRQLMRIARADLFPSLGISAGGSYSEANRPNGFTTETEEYSLSLGASWEVDLWGKVRNSSAASEAEYMAAGFDLEQARHSIVAAVCSAWYRCIAAQEQLHLAEATVESYSSTADLVRNRFESGIDTALDYRLAVANAESAKSSLASRKETFKRSVRALQILLGRYPNAELQLVERLPSVQGSIPADIPASILERRPDIRAAERRLASAAYDVKAAKRAKLPSINITGATGLQTEVFSELLDGNYDFWSAGVSVSQSIFAGGRIDANQKRAEALVKQYEVLYEQTALDAFFEVEQALDADLYYTELENASIAAREQSVEAEKLAWDQYTAGIIDIVTVLESQRFALNAKQSAIEARNARLQNRIQLFLSLGGDV